MLIELTSKQAQLLDDYLFKKICRLKDAGLEDSDCFKEFSLIHDKLRNCKAQIAKIELIEK